MTTAFDSVCHEHATYYDLCQLERLYRENGLTLISASWNSVNGGSVRTKAVKKGIPLDISGMPQAQVEDVMAFAHRTAKWCQKMREWIDLTLLRRGPIWGYGASTKGAALLQYLNRSSHFVGIADRNPRKHGKMMAGVWVPITDEETMRKAKPEYLFVLPWSFRDEFVEREQPLLRAGATMVLPLPNPEFVL